MKLRVFQCDNCDKQTTAVQENRTSKDSCDDATYSTFPYKDGWIYVYNLSIKKYIALKDRVLQFNLRDKHFCCVECQIQFFEKLGN